MVGGADKRGAIRRDGEAVAQDGGMRFAFPPYEGKYEGRLP
jgi:hypothetical protein